MSTATYILGIVASLVTLVIVVELLRRRQLRERHAIWWLFASVLAVIAGVFPGVLSALAALVGVGLPVNLVFFVSIAILVLVCIQHSAELTRLEAKTRTLAESVALLDLRVRDLEAPPASSPSASPEARDDGAS
ncbi:DUF2304 domain-containing protein [Salinibacterium sp. ZJ77]|uniref:DUF2304 domain-containing protein n=1 Tax=Salinibacterium sp. ZJ77 TaxID=2708337 RepID=UPI001421F0CA|nr:DUF2304 domain-containing protein [Salinibacterium sp. ZJ77]